jgi:Mycothiol maleylpyruvate isomerase N-terminal domain
VAYSSRLIKIRAPAQLHDPTPCTEWDVEQLRDHVMGWLATFAAGFADPGGQAPRSSLDGYEPPADPVAEVRTATRTLTGAVRADAVSRPLLSRDNEDCSVRDPDLW